MKNMPGVLGRIEPDRKLQLPEDLEAAAAKFLTLLGKHGLVELLPDDAFIELPPEDNFEKEVEVNDLIRPAWLYHYNPGHDAERITSGK